MSFNSLISIISWDDPKFIGAMIILLVTLLFLGKKWFSGPICRKIENLTGKVVIITGSNTGIGKETARALANFGATVILACRDEKRANEALIDIKSTTKNNNVHFMKLDLSDFDSIRLFARNFKNKYDKLHILINNAGLNTRERATTKQGFEMHFGVNHLGHFLLTSLLMDVLKTSSPSRVINVSSMGNKFSNFNFEDLQAEKSYVSFDAYCKSKLANIAFTCELNKRSEKFGVKAFSLHPGAVITEISRDSLKVWYIKFFIYLLWPILYYTFKNTIQGAQTTIFCAVQDFNLLKGGEYYSDCKIAKTNPQGKDDKLMIKLWEKSEELMEEKFNI